MKLNGFDRIAGVYDFLARLVFGNSIFDAQKFFLNKIDDGSKVLILGGGTGRILEELVNERPNCEVWYIEASQKMIRLSKNRITPSKAIHFIHGTENDIPQSMEYDVLITNFYLDLFTDNQLALVVSKLQKAMRPRSLWIVTDFVNYEKWWQVWLLKIMYWFFRTTSHIESEQLPEWDQCIKRTRVMEVNSKMFYKNFIKTVLYRF